MTSKSWEHGVEATELETRYPAGRPPQKPVKDDDRQKQADAKRDER